MDFLFAKSFPEFHSIFSKWLSVLDKSKYGIYAEAAVMSSAFNSVAQFMKKVRLKYFYC